jgi:hypothetical protein
MTVGNAFGSAAEALEAGVRWRQEEEARYQTEITEVDQELARVREAIQNLQQQLSTLSQHRSELASRGGGFEEAEAERVYADLFATLGAQAQAVEARSQELAAAEQAQAQAYQAVVSDPATRALLDQYKAFKATIEPTLAMMPEAYRSAILAAHEALSAQLKAKLGSVDTGPVEHPGPELTVDVLFAVDAPEGSADILMLVLPVPEAVQSEWADRPDTAGLRLAARVAQGVYAACHQIGAPHAHAMFGGHQGLLAMELELPGGDPAKVTAVVQAALDAALAGPEEMKRARMVARAVNTAAEYLLPPEEEEGEDVG